jgi:uncharacterized LabA/DUF88 family protein
MEERQMALQMKFQGTVDRIKFYLQQLFTPEWPETQSRPQRLAVLIDAENMSHHILHGLFEELAKYGVACVRRAYGDWTLSSLNPWPDYLQEYAIMPVHQVHYTTGKNASDSAMIIDAMDLLYNRKLDAFCIVSSDSDFTRLAGRIREAGLTVLGVGENQTPKAFVQTCDRFIYTEILRKNGQKNGRPKVKPGQKLSASSLQKEAWLVKLLRHAVEDACNEMGWANLSTIGSVINNKAPDFDARNYGYSKLLDLMRAINLFHINANSTTIQVRDRQWQGNGANSHLLELLRQAIAQASQEGGWAFLGTVGAALHKIDPEFDYQNYKVNNLSSLLRSTGKFELEKRDNGQWYVRDPGANSGAR